MRDAQPRAVHLQDYRPPAYLINRTDLVFELHEDYALVSSRLEMRRAEGIDSSAPLELHGQELELESLSIDDRELSSAEYTVSADQLTLYKLPATFTFACRTRIFPHNNTALEGLYKSRTMFCTQCEAEGFRKITYYLDRPDVMSVFTVTVEAQQDRYPVLLSNGNPIASEKLPEGRHRAVWRDPFPKPAYLFALVAGDLAHIENSFSTCSGREVALRIYVEAKDVDKCDHAMRSLQAAMQWDEEVYGREYDLDIFNIVAVDDFNMGAMENKGLNIFNTSCVLCSPQTTTDQGYQRVEAIVAHEYFHNWSGNRVTCRDWFQLSLKEGFTVFRDAQFSADRGSAAVKRVEDASFLRTVQFAEDAGPMAHPVQPASFIEINNFYTTTVYEKGAEVVGMVHTLLGAENFRRGSDLYFQRHDGQAVTCEDFVQAMEDASGVDLVQFRRWYSQAGTPQLSVTGEYDAENQQYSLRVRQSCPDTPGQSAKQALLIPLAMGLLGEAGNLPLHLAGAEPDLETADNTHCVLRLEEPEQEFVFERVTEPPVPSLLRGFSAPVRLEFDYQRADFCALMSRDDDGFVRWDSAQQLAIDVIREVEAQILANAPAAVDPLLPEACSKLLDDDSLDPAMVAEMLRLPSENLLAELASREGGANVHSLHRARETVREAIGQQGRERLLQRYGELQRRDVYIANAEQIAGRSLRNTCLDLLVCGDKQYLQLAVKQFESAGNMTDSLAALRLLAFYGDEQQRENGLARFYETWQHESLVVNQWFQIQAAIPGDEALARVRKLMLHADFDLRNPNKVRSLVGVYSGQNAVGFHRRDGAGYVFLRELVAQLNESNPQMAARLLAPLTRWHNYSEGGELMRAELELLAALPALSPDVYEVVSKSLQAPSG